MSPHGTVHSDTGSWLKSWHRSKFHSNSRSSFYVNSNYAAKILSCIEAAVLKQKQQVAALVASMKELLRIATQESTKARPGSPAEQGPSLSEPATSVCFRSTASSWSWSAYSDPVADNQVRVRDGSMSKHPLLSRPE